MSELPALEWPTEAPAFGRVRLRAFRPADVAMVVELARDPYVPTIGTLPADATSEQADEWLERQHERWTSGAGFSFAVADVSTDEAVGSAGLSLKDRQQGRAAGGYAIAPPRRGRGYAGDALTAVTAFAWTIPGLHRVELYIEQWNAASIATAQRAGYVAEGLLRSHQEIGGERRDMLLFAAVSS